MGEQHADGGAQNRDWQAVREDIGLTRSELGSKLPCDTKTVGRWERGETTPAIAHQREMLRLLDEATPDGCGALGCLSDAAVVIDHPDHGKRTVCESHATGFDVLEVLAHV